MNHSSFNVPSLEKMGALLPAFDFSALIASNDFNAVFLANQRSLERQVAIKILAPDVSGDPGFCALFESTARSMAKLNHPNLISIYDSGSVDGMLYFVMEFVPGKSLAHSTRGTAVEFRQAALIVDAIGEGLAHAHAHHIIHGDLNPSHILLNQKAEPKIGNFGFSHPAGEVPTAHDSIRFVAPEVLACQSAATVQSDIFAVGAILYELVTGQPHGPDAPPPSGLCHCGPGIDEIWRQATATDPRQRMADVGTFQQALKDAAGGGSRARLTSSAPVSPKFAVQSTPDVPTPTARGPRHSPKVGFNWKLMRNLCIIAGLLYAINIAWKNLDTAKSQREKEIRESLARTAAAKEKAYAEARQKALKLAKRKSTEDASAQASSTPAETPAESLSRLRDALASGKRTDMPLGSIRNGENDYMLIEEPMSWPQAAWFAEQHGAHLAIPNASADITWLVGNFPTEQGIWIGAARSGRKNWALADGSAWKPTKLPAGVGLYLAADKHGFLRTENGKALHPFIIQWHRDGSNPGALAALLSSIRSSITQQDPVFPPGTETYGVRHYLFVSRPVTWRDAVDFADHSGGNLAVPSAIAETINLEEMTSDLKADHGIWLGGFLKGNHWLWITGEPWKTAKWADGSVTTAPDSALILRPGKGWDAQNLSEPASGFIIEWSNDRKSSTSPEIEKSVPVDETSALIAKAADLIKAADAKRAENLAVNAHKFTWDLDSYLRSLKKSDQLTWSQYVGRLKLSVENNRVPTAITSSSGIELSEPMAKILEFNSRKQGEIDMEFAKEVDKIRSAFVLKLQDAQAQAKQSGQPKLVESIGEALDKANNFESWLRSFGVHL